MWLALRWRTSPANTGPEAVPPEADRLMADVDPALEQEILDVTRREREANVRHHHEPDNLG
jgi:hypothetical protein